MLPVLRFALPAVLIVALLTGAILMALPVGAAPAFQATALPTNTPRATALPTNTPRPAPVEPTLTPAPVEPTQPVFLPTPTLYYPPDFEPRQEQPTAIPTAMPRLSAMDTNGSAYQVLNVLLLGHDGEVTPGDPNFHTDTMIVVSINRDTNTLSMISLPRDLFVYIPNWGMGRLNTAWGYGESIGWTDGGWGMLRQTILYNFGIETHYYAMVDFSGFERLIDTLGGVTIAVDCPIVDKICDAEHFAECTDGVPGNEPDEAYILKTLDVGVYAMNGEDALWYARSRKNTTDFDRGRRQQQILRAMWAASKSAGLITELPSLYGDLTGVVQTNMPLQEILPLMPLALSLEPNAIENHFFRKNVETQAWQPAIGPFAGAFVQIPDPNGGMQRLIENFLSPPTQNRLVLENAAIEIYNGTSNANWDIVAAERLVWEGFAPVAAGQAESLDYPRTTIIDYTGQSKGSSLNDLVRWLNIRPEDITLQPDPNRTTDFKIVLGSSYNSCVEREWTAPENVQ